MAKKAAKPKHVEPEDIKAQEAVEAQEPTAPGKITKAEAIRRALAKGLESPEDAVGFIKSQFGLEVSKAHFSASKSQIKSKEAEAEATAPKSTQSDKPKETPSQSVEGYLAPPSKQRADSPDLIDSLETLKPLIAQYGSEKVKRLVDLLG